MQDSPYRFDRRIWIGVSLLFLIGILHRALQLRVLWSQLAITIGTAPDLIAMQLLPKAIMSEHPWWGMWFLQQSPPLPNIIWAAVLFFTQSPFRLAIIFLLFSALLSCVAAAAMAVLFIRVGVRWWLGLILALVFLLGSDLLLLEYNPFGYLYYEMMTMLLGVLACHAALSLVDTKRWRSALSLGLCVAGLALTRATFSYFWPIVLVWLFCAGFWRQPKILVIFLLPVFLLHGGWAFKNYWVHGYWSWGMSSWGGINMQSGERYRNGSKFNQWVAQQPAMCASPWYEFTAKDVNYFGFIPLNWPELPSAVAERDKYIANRRGNFVVLDSVAAHLWSQCLVTEFSRYWWTHPEILIRGSWRSYEMFWLPIRQFEVIRPFPLRIGMDKYAEGVHWFRALRDSWREWGADYRICQVPYVISAPDSGYAPAKIIALPFFASFISAFNFVLLHSAPFLLLFAWGFQQRLDWPKGFGFFWLIYCYSAGLSSLVEYPENMRFRIELEPIIWVTCIVVAERWVRCFSAMAGQPIVEHR